jgi:hypothetical protein
MRNFLMLVALLASLMTLTQCKSDDTDTPTPDANTGAVTFKVDSLTDFNSSKVGSVWESTNSTLNLTAKGGKSIISISVVMPNGFKTGTYNFTASSSALMATFYRPDSSVITEGYFSNIDTKSFGTVNITSITTDSIMTGTFTFTLKDPVSAKIKKIANGVFTKVKVADNKSLVVGGSNTFSAKIDGVLFSPKQITATKFFGKISIVGSDGTKTIGLTVLETAKVGTYTMDFFGDYTAQFNPSMSSTNPASFVASSTTSKLTITEHNTSTKVIKGTYNFKGEEFLGTSTKAYMITEGAFKLSY